MATTLWTGVDFQRRIIVLNKPEKNGPPRIFNVSRKLVDMLNSLPRKDKRVFGSSVNWYKSIYSNLESTLQENFKTKDS